MSKKRNNIIRLTEVKADFQIKRSQGRSQFLGIEEMIFRNELAILLNEQTRNQAVQPIFLSEDQRAFSQGVGFIKQNTDYICGQIQQRLASQNLHVHYDEIKRYLQNVDRLFEAGAAKGEHLTAIRFVPTSIPYTFEEYKSNAKKKEPKKGNARPVILFGVLYPSVAAAQRANPSVSYDSIRKSSLRELNALKKRIS